MGTVVDSPHFQDAGLGMKEGAYFEEKSIY